ncbi:uncharacterized protein BXZ73DRAFT_99911 [Epithele typhae]|uniref:uncharacterized protein n=1 Tax=Epithele typhae TaxID=378194 RepID=UPI00200887C6|nr:uncharacterized protein BXZ73DRAFT_99911 [Epithele typhae]KAH9938853.1 hypothetical protein BXZ73DRAFT_99911 [Epithele typhae]
MVQVNDFALDALRTDVLAGFPLLFVTTGLCAGMITLLSIVFVATIYVLIRKGIRLRSVKILLAAVTFQYISTIAYYAFLLGGVARENDDLLSVANSLNDPDYVPPADGLPLYSVTVGWVITALFNASSFVSDAIGIIGALLSGKRSHLSSTMFISRNGFGLAFTLLTLTSNIIPTMLIAYRAWKHRESLYVGERRALRSPALGVLLLLIESGAAYAMVWILVATFEITGVADPNGAVAKRTVSSPLFNEVFGLCLTSVVALYPMVIIIVVYTRFSPLEHVSIHLSTNVNFSQPSSPASMPYAPTPLPYTPTFASSTEQTRSVSESAGPVSIMVGGHKSFDAQTTPV